MPKTPRLTALLDANVLYPAPLRDLMLTFAAEGLYRVKWTDRIQEEWARNLLRKRPDLQASNLQYTIEQMSRAFPDANIVDFQELESSLTLPDPDDRHVLAAAIKGGVDVIATFNLKDFPAKYLEQFDVVPQLPDEFIGSIIDGDAVSALKALRVQVSRLRKPLLPVAEVLNKLEATGLKESVAKFRGLLEDI